MKSKILNPKRMKQLIDFKGLELDNGIYPTDIDGLIEYHDSEYILLEVKHKDARVPYGQRLAIQRMVDDFTKAGKKAVAIVCEHKVDDTDKPVVAAFCKVRELYYGGEHKWRPPDSPMNVRQAIDKFRKYAKQHKGGCQVKVITISGKAQNGKDTTAGLLKAALEADGYKVLITHYADLLKYICKQFFGWDGQKDDAGRHILQYVGTDIIRQKHPDYWVGFVTSILELFPNEWDYVLIPDCRFPNEIDYLKEAGMDTVNLRVVRKNFKSPLTPEQQAHPSETALDDVEPDYYITNNGSMTDLKRNVIDWLVEYLGSHQMTIDEL